MKQFVDRDIKEFLESVPLYVWREFANPMKRETLWIKEIDAVCEKCEQLRPFHILNFHAPVGIRNVFFEFGCVSCEQSKRKYRVEQIVNGITIRLQKYGELPKKQLERNPVLQRFLRDDLDNYEKAVVCLSHEYGVAAFVYFRRIVENNINKLLDLVQEDAQSSRANTEATSALIELKKDSPMKDKIKIANHALPEHLNPDGLNPLGRLYQVLSEGVHNLSEEACLDKAKITSECLAYLVSELASRKKHRTQFKSAVGEL